MDDRAHIGFQKSDQLIHASPRDSSIQHQGDQNLLSREIAYRLEEEEEEKDEEDSYTRHLNYQTKNHCLRKIRHKTPDQNLDLLIAEGLSETSRAEAFRKGHKQKTHRKTTLRRTEVETEINSFIMVRFQLNKARTQAQEKSQSHYNACLENKVYPVTQTPGPAAEKIQQAWKTSDYKFSLSPQTRAYISPETTEDW